MSPTQLAYFNSILQIIAYLADGLAKEPSLLIYHCLCCNLNVTNGDISVAMSGSNLENISLT